MQTQKTILVIEDDETQQEVYRVALSRAGYKVFVRDNAYSGLQWLQQIIPDLIVLDIMLPGLSGEEMLSEIRQNPNGEDVPVVVVTAAASIQESDFQKYEIAAFMPKPFLPKQLIEQVQTVLANT